MKYYPIFLDIRKRKCLVVGGGAVGMRKALLLEKSQADVTLVSPDINENVIQEHPGIRFLKKTYAADDISGMFFVFAATDNAVLNAEIREDARQQDVLCNVADAPDSGDFLLPSVMERGDLSIAVSTGGKSPAMARTIKKELEAHYGCEYEVFLNLMGRVRTWLLEKGHDPQAHKKIFYQLIEKDLPGLIREKDQAGVEIALIQVLGEGHGFMETSLW